VNDALREGDFNSGLTESGVDGEAQARGGSEIFPRVGDPYE
jgi:hypothetical protein